MWHWDQGHLPYFQFDALRKIAEFVISHDFKNETRAVITSATGLEFAAPATHSPWRNYSRVLKLALLVSEVGDHSQATPVAAILAKAGMVTCDEYMHFLVRAFTDPSPALTAWNPKASFRYPLLFSLKYLLAKVAISSSPMASINEIVGAYQKSGLTGAEGEDEFIAAVRSKANYEAIGSKIDHRQAAESLKVIAQISYLHIKSRMMTVSLNPADASEVFADLSPIIGPCAPDREAEIRRLAELFRDGSTSIAFDYPNTTLDEAVESGFSEGGKVKKTHITIERNGALRKEYFRLHPVTKCDVCTLETSKSYPWAERILDLHHLLPLSSGTRVESKGTTFDDMVPICPTCHRATHRYYDQWLSRNSRSDFEDRKEARDVYGEMKSKFPGHIYA